MRSLVVVRCSLIVCLVAQIGLQIRISDKGRHAHDTDEVQLFHGDRCREQIREEEERLFGKINVH